MFQQYAVMCRPEEQPTMIQDFLHIYVKNNGRAIVFCNTKNEVMELCSGILRREAKAFHGDIAQASRSFILKVTFFFLWSKKPFNALYCMPVVETEIQKLFSLM